MQNEISKGFLKEVVKHLQGKILFLEQEIAGLKKEKIQDEELRRKLSDELTVLKKKYFDQKSESKKKTANANSKNNHLLIHNQSPLDDNTPTTSKNLKTEEVIHKLIDLICQYCQSKNIRKMKDCYEKSHEMTMRDKEFIVKKHLREKWSCNDCGKITTAKGSVKLIPGGKFSIEIGVCVIDDKFNNHLPLERQRKIMNRLGLKIDVKTLYGLMDHIEKLLSPIVSMIRAEILSRACVNIDESPMNIFYPEKQKGYIWSISNNYGTYYQYELTRSGKVAKEMLKGFKGAVVADGFSGYNFLHDEEDIQFGGCWAHARRKFFEAESNYPKANEMVALIDKLYKVEHKANSFEELKKLRTLESAQIVVDIETWLRKIRGHHLKSSTIGKAVTYLSERLAPFKRRGKIVNKNHVGVLKEFLTTPHMSLDNNKAERSQRDPVMGRNNFHGFRTIDGADLGMTFYTLIGSCKTLKINPRDYLLEMAARAVKGEKLLTPFQYGKQLQEQQDNG